MDTLEALFFNAFILVLLGLIISALGYMWYASRNKVGLKVETLFYLLIVWAMIIMAVLAYVFSEMTK